MNNIVALETGSLHLEFDKNNGSLVTIYSKVSDWYVFNRPHLALSWRLMLPLKDRRNNNAWGNRQKAVPLCAAGNDFVRFRWDSVESELAGIHDISITTECVVRDDQAVFKMHIENSDNIVVENVYYPYIGDMHRPKDAKRFTLMRGIYFGMYEYEMWPTFANPVGTHGVDYPTLTTQASGNPPMQPFALVADEKGNGLYMGVGERQTESVTWHAEAHPGWRSSIDFRLFGDDSAFRHDVYTRFCLGHIPFVMPGTQFDLLPFAMEAYKGTFAKGCQCYTRISKKWNDLPNIPDWAKRPHSWFQVHINSPEDELRIRFTDLPKLGEECRKYGVDAIQLVGWNNGGQDRGNPSHDPDPRLGTADELKQAIGKIQSTGIKLVLFAKFNWADQSLPDFKDKYEPLSVKDPYGNYYVYNGYMYQTISQIADVNTRRLIPMCYHSEEYLNICKQEFRKCLDLGADGILYDENQHHGQTLCCFDENHGHRYGICTYSADEHLIDIFRSMIQDRDFLIAGEASYDFQLNYYDISYARTWGRDHVPYTRIVRPDANLMTSVTGFNDRSMINQCLLNRYIISYEPFNFKGRLSDFPDTVAYGMKMDKLRTDLREYFWDGIFRERIGGGIKVCGQKEEFRHYAVYDGTNGRQGMVICNYDEEKAITVEPILESGQKLTHYRMVEDEGPTPFQGCFTIAPMSAAVVYQE